MRSILVNLLALIGFLGLLAALFVGWYVFSGRYNIAAAEPHFPLVRAALDRAFYSSVRAQAENVSVPRVGSEPMAEGARIYARECARCHALPGGERPSWTRGLRPEPPHLAEEGTPLDLPAIYWLVQNGARMTAMPSWQHVLSEREAWAIARFVEAMPRLTAGEYQELVADEEAAPEDSDSGAGADASGAATQARPEVQATGPGEETVGQRETGEPAGNRSPRSGRAGDSEAPETAGAPAPGQQPSAADRADGTEAAATVGMTNSLKFTPEEVTIAVGQTVVWQNDSDLRHTVTADPGKASSPESVDLPDGAEPFDSGTLQPGQTWSRTFDVPGRYRYFCIPHEGAGMIGVLNVEPAGRE